MHYLKFFPQTLWSTYYYYPLLYPFGKCRNWSLVRISRFDSRFCLQSLSTDREALLPPTPAVSAPTNTLFLFNLNNLSLSVFLSFLWLSSFGKLVLLYAQDPSCRCSPKECSELRSSSPPRPPPPNPMPLTNLSIGMLHYKFKAYTHYQFL